MQLLKLNLTSGTKLLLNRSHIQSVRALVEGTAIRNAFDKLPYVVTQPLNEVATKQEYISGIVIPLVIRNDFGTLEYVSINVDTIVKVVEGFEENTSYVFLDNNTTRYLAMSTVDEIETVANSVVGSGGVPVDSNLASAYLVNVNVIAGENTITHAQNAQVATVYVKLAESWIPWAWNDIAGNTNQIIMLFDEPSVVQIRILLIKPTV